MVVVTAFNQCLSWAGWTSYEAMLGLVIYNEYGWEGAPPPPPRPREPHTRLCHTQSALSL